MDTMDRAVFKNPKYMYTAKSKKVALVNSHW